MLVHPKLATDDKGPGDHIEGDASGVVLAPGGTVHPFGTAVSSAVQPIQIQNHFDLVINRCAHSAE